MSNFADRQAYDVDDLVEGLKVVARIGLLRDQLARAAATKPSLATLLGLELFGPPDSSLQERVGKLAEALTEVLPRLGEARLASAADALLSISPEYRGQDWKQRKAAAEYIWYPYGYSEPRNFSRPLNQIIMEFATELFFYLQEKARDLAAASRPTQENTQGHTPARRSTGNSESRASICKTKYEQRTRDGRSLVRYAIRYNYQGRWLTKFVGKADWEALSLTFYDIETRQKVEAITVI